ncbi:MAG: DUF3501 family protein [Nitrospira sp.]|nr:DUF3501 family protein [Nitrospira sp.]MBX3340483.1 DUF3501 family protein [Nitrospira sp.]MBX7038861.1 DUF3501 family protein [Nitrospira sp.]MCW5793908.1 DUF3501 family protein [Nitrospira sp.]HMU30731.1 DUF3501 family protein [Nitrospira sp.]
MNQLTQADLLPPDEYERQREAYRQTIIDLKRRRRISIGDKITMVFENRETLRFQIQEMIRVERILDPQKVQDEVDVYNALLPAPGELSATLLIELTDAETMKHWLDLFMGLDHGQKLGLRAGGEIVYGEFEGGHSHETKISAVHFVRFRPTPAMVTALADPAVRAALSVRHAGYEADAEVPWTMRQEWLADLRG